jgi:hypothetical protein
VLDCRETRRVALAHIGSEGELVLVRRMCPRLIAADLRPALLQRQFIEPRLLAVKPIADAVELLGRHHVRRHALFDFGKALVIGFLERLEGAHHVAIGAGDLAVGHASGDLGLESSLHSSHSFRG